MPVLPSKPTQSAIAVLWLFIGLLAAPMAGAAISVDGAGSLIWHSDWTIGLDAGEKSGYLRGDGDLDFAVWYKSQRSFQPLKFSPADSNGAPRRLSLDSPSIFAADGSVAGFGWDSLSLFSTGGEYVMSEDLFLRFGYAFNQNQVPDKNTTFKIPAPAVIKHHGSIGLSWQVADAWYFDMAYRRGFENSISSEIANPNMGRVPGSQVVSRMSTQSLIFGFRVDF